MEERGATVVASTPEQFNGVVAGDLDRWGKVIREAGRQDRLAPGRFALPTPPLGSVPCPG
jgi:hypothetical protein